MSLVWSLEIKPWGRGSWHNASSSPLVSDDIGKLGEKMITHEFVLCPEIPDEICYSDYAKKDMTIISDDFIVKNQRPFSNVKMYCQYIGNEIDGLDYHGITIITSKMAVALRAELTDCCNPSNELNLLIAILDESIATQYYVIHFGV